MTTPTMHPNDSTARRMEVAGEILRQLGGARMLTTLIGAKQFVAIQQQGNPGLQFRIPTSRGVNLIYITLTPEDTYDVAFRYIRGCKLAIKGDTKGLYHDQLMDEIEEATGLFLTLHPRK